MVVDGSIINDEKLTLLLLVYYNFHTIQMLIYIWYSYLELKNSYFHMSSAVRSLFRYEAEIWSTRRQPSAAKQAEYRKTDSNIFRVRLGSLKKHWFIVNFEVMFDKSS
jgi:hypothetical protein